MTSPFAGLIPIEPNGKRPLVAWEQYQHRPPTLEETAGFLEKTPPDRNWAQVTGTVSQLVVLDVDPRHGGSESIKGRVLPPTRTIRTPSGGHHYYFKHPGGLVPPAVGILPGVDLRGDGACALVPPSIIDGNAYEVVVDEPVAPCPHWLLELVAQGRVRTEGAQSERIPDRIPEGQRNATLTSLAGTMRRRGASEAAIRAALIEENERCDPPLPEHEVDQIARSVSRYPTAEERSVGETLAKDAWPSPLAPEAFHGLAGEFIRVIEPHTEADPAALLFQFLVSVGSAVGRNPYFVAEADRHYLNEFLVIVGETGKGGRKGSSWGHIRQRLASADPVWTKDNVKSGLATGEGVIWAVRDAIEGYEKVREKGQPTRYERVITDEGIQDKRLLALETEFARVLRVMARDGNILSTVVRQAWDTGDLHTLTKTTPAKSTGAHISVIGHITQPELRLHLSTTDATNGLANRFLWACSRRSKILPEGGQLGDVDFAELERRLATAIEFGKSIGEMKRDNDARAIWREVYPALTEGELGLLGAITSRAEAHVMRLACIYAVLDGSGTIRKEHLLAALAVWDYVAESCRYIFGHLVGDRVADAILHALRENRDGMSRTQIYNLLGGHVKDENTTRALLLLKEQGLARMESRTTRGRAAEWWFASGHPTRGGAGE